MWYLSEIRNTMVGSKIYASMNLLTILRNQMARKGPLRNLTKCAYGKIRVYMENYQLYIALTNIRPCARFCFH